MKIDCTDPFCVFRFLQSVYTNYLDHVKKNDGKLVTKILDIGRAWKGGSAAEYKQHLIDIQALMAKVPQQLSGTCEVINLIIENLVEDPKLEAAHTVIRTRYNDDPAKVTFPYVERETVLVFVCSYLYTQVLGPVVTLDQMIYTVVYTYVYQYILGPFKHGIHYYRVVYGSAS